MPFHTGYVRVLPTMPATYKDRQYWIDGDTTKDEYHYYIATDRADAPIQSIEPFHSVVTAGQAARKQIDVMTSGILKPLEDLKKEAITAEPDPTPAPKKRGGRRKQA